MDIALFGCGYAGSNWATALDSNENVDTLYCVDPDPSKSSVLTNLSSGHFYNLDVFDSNELSPPEKAQYRSLTECDIWIVAVNYKLHERFISLAEQVGIDTILVEKPVTEKPERNRDETECDVFVNYVETVHPVFESIIARARKDNATIHTGFHWRGKNAMDSVGIQGKHKYEHPAVKDDLVHDISELYIGFQFLNQDELLKLDEITTLKRWDEVTVDDVKIAPHFTDDAWARLEFTTKDGEYTVQGGFTDEQTRRFFFWVDTTQEIGYYGNTLTRSFTSPAAYVVSGLKDIEFVEKSLKSGDVVTKEDEKRLFNQVESEKLSISKDEHSFSIVLERLLDDKPLPRWYDAVQIEKIAEQFYLQSPVSYGSDWDTK